MSNVVTYLDNLGHLVTNITSTFENRRGENDTFDNRDVRFGPNVGQI